MRNRKVVIINDQVLDAAGTVILNLDFSNPITRLIIGVKGKMGNASNTNNPRIERYVSKVEIVDGSDVLFSMSMVQLCALQFYSGNGLPYHSITCHSYTDGNRIWASIYFGRDDSDNEWMFDPKRFVNPQLKITYAFTENAANWTDNGQKLTVTAMIAENPNREASGFLMAKEVYSWLSAAAGDETVDLPRDYIYRLMLLQAYDMTTPLYGQISNVKISCDMDRFVPLNEEMRDIHYENFSKYGMQVVNTEAIGDGGTDPLILYHPFYHSYGGDISSWAGVADVAIENVYSGYNGAHDTGGGFIGANERAIANCHGLDYQACDVIRFGNLKDIEEFLDPTPYKSVRMILTEAGAAALRNAVILQQVRNY